MKRKPLVPLTILLTVALLTGACKKEEEEPPELSTIEYTLTSLEEGKQADIEYTYVFGKAALEDIALPWSDSFKAVYRIGDALTFTAESGDQGEMEARILVDGQVVASETGQHYVRIEYIRGLK